MQRIGGVAALRGGARFDPVQRAEQWKQAVGKEEAMYGEFCNARVSLRAGRG